MTTSNKQMKWFTPKSAAAIVGVGAILAPFTGGLSLAYAAGQLAVAAAIDTRDIPKD